jgi:hypothetical protein
MKNITKSQLTGAGACSSGVNKLFDIFDNPDSIKVTKENVEIVFDNLHKDDFISWLFYAEDGNLMSGMTSDENDKLNDYQYTGDKSAFMKEFDRVYLQCFGEKLSSTNEKKMIITVSMLQSVNACSNGIEEFRALFGEEAEITYDNVLKAARYSISNMHFLVCNLFLKNQPERYSNEYSIADNAGTLLPKEYAHVFMKYAKVYFNATSANKPQVTTFEWEFDTYKKGIWCENYKTYDSLQQAQQAILDHSVSSSGSNVNNGQRIVEKTNDAVTNIWNMVQDTTTSTTTEYLLVAGNDLCVETDSVLGYTNSKDDTLNIIDYRSDAEGWSKDAHFKYVIKRTETARTASDKFIFVKE